MTSLPSASYWWLLELCPAAATYPWTARITLALEAGRVRHEHLQRVGSGITVEESLALVPARWRPMCEAIQTDRLSVRDGPYLCEVAMAYAPETSEAIVLGVGLSREQRQAAALRERVAFPDGWILGTIDRIGLTSDAVEVADFKGWWDDVGEPEESLQLAIYALAAQAIEQWARPLTRLRFDRIGEDGRTWAGEPVTVGSEWMAQMRARLLAAVEDVQLARANPTDARHVVGTHCTRCPAVRVCREQRAALARVEAGAVEISSRDEATAWALSLPGLRSTLDHIDAAVKACAAQEPLVGPDGRVYGPEPEDDLAHSETGPLIMELARWVAAQMPNDPDPGLTEARGDVVSWATQSKVSITAEGVKALARKFGPKGQLGETIRDIRDALRRAGVVKQRQVFKWRKPEAKALPEGQS